jgi:hypothetical protein
VSAAALTLPGEQAAPIHLNLIIGDEESGEGTTSTSTVRPDGTPGDTLEKVIIDKSAEAFVQFVQNNGFMLGDEAATDRYAVTRVNIEPPNKIIVPINSRNVLISGISFDLAIKITQNRFQFDRKARYQFALAIENKITGKVMAATRVKDADFTDITKLRTQEPNGDEPVLENGSTMKITLKGFFSFEEYLDAIGTDKTPASIPSE